MAKLKLGIDLHNRTSVFMPEQGYDYDINRLVDLVVMCEDTWVLFSISRRQLVVKTPLAVDPYIDSNGSQDFKDQNYQPYPHASPLQ